MITGYRLPTTGEIAAHLLTANYGITPVIWEAPRNRAEGIVPRRRGNGRRYFADFALPTLEEQQARCQQLVGSMTE